ncbi:MAG: sulfatase-like hydrolase/transferase, partial [Gammaproteobacteria bacterium]|nr:sulfatase-like hydrolase/transferase [Gammaproteobacteria bacterium]
MSDDTLALGSKEKPKTPPIAGGTTKKANIVFILADDAGYSDFGFQAYTDPTLAGRTPNIDSIAKAGVQFTSAYMSASVCSPSRAG